MPHYINFLRNRPLPTLGKKEWLIKHAKAKSIPIPEEWVEDLVCVEDTHINEIAEYITNQEDLNEIKADGEEWGHKMDWLLVPGAKEMR